jgi:hypothetical protein
LIQRFSSPAPHKLPATTSAIRKVKVRHVKHRYQASLCKDKKEQQSGAPQECILISNDSQPQQEQQSAAEQSEAPLRPVQICRASFCTAPDGCGSISAHQLYVQVVCSKQCVLHFHHAGCWRKLTKLVTNRIWKHGMPCLQAGCMGEIITIIQLQNQEKKRTIVGDT